MALGAEAHAGDPLQDWKTVETKHFVINYYEPLGDIARRVGALAERSHRVLVPVLGHAPKTKTQIVLVDDTDGANGFASVLPRNRITLFATAPSGLSSLNDHDDWLYGLTAHEYTHILHLDTIGGFPALYNKIFGKQWAPNQVQPRWIIEGIATYQESKQSSSGRTRSALFDMFLRVPTLAGTTLRLDKVTNGSRYFPHGTAAYLYGSHFLKYVFDRYGEKSLKTMSHAYGSNPIPYGINRSIATATKRGFDSLYAEWNAHLRRKYSLKKRSLERRGIREGRRLTFSGELNTGPMYTKDGKWIVWRQNDGLSRSRFRALPSGGNVGASREYAIIDRAGTFEMLGDGSMVVEQSRNFRSNYSYQEIGLWNKRTKRLDMLTRGLRARSPTISPDERQIAFVINGLSKTKLAVMPLRAEAKPRIVYEGKGRYDQVTAPAYSPDGKKLAISAWRAGGYRDILIVDIRTGKATELMRDRAIEADPIWDPKGRYLYYSSDRNGIYNVYAYELATKKTWQVTNVLGCALVPAISPDGKRMAYQGFDERGFEIFEMTLDKSRWLEPELYVNTRPDPVKIRNDEVEVSKAKDFRPLATLAPQTYTVQLLANSFGNSLNASTRGADIIGRHSYSLVGTVGLEQGNVSYGGSYVYNRLWPSFRAVFGRSAARRGGVILDGENTLFTEESYGLTVGIGIPVLRLPMGSATMSFDYDVDWLRNVDDEYMEPDPNDFVPRFPETDVRVAGLALRWSYSDQRGFAHTIGPQEGKVLSAALRVDHPALGSDFHGLTLNYRYQTYYKLPWGLTPVLSMRLAGGISTTNRRRSGVFAFGGLPNQDIVQSLINNLRAGNTGFLRGYESRAAVGRQFHLMNLEYRHEIALFERGVSTLPFYIRRLHFAGLLDVGDAFDGPIDLRTFKVGAGGALRLDMLFGYFVPGSLELGYARGLTETGVNEYWMLLTGTI